MSPVELHGLRLIRNVAVDKASAQKAKGVAL
jgi:hypothetical protein